MNEPVFFITIFAGFLLILLSFAWCIADFRKAKKLLLKTESEKSELITAISDIESMVDELNTFSNSIISRIDEKNYEAGIYLERLNEALDRAKAFYADTTAFDVPAFDAENEDEGECEGVDDGERAAPVGRYSGVRRRVFRLSTARYYKPQPVVVSPRGRKYRQALKYAETGMDEIEIARALDIGRGEVALISGLRAGGAAAGRKSVVG